MTAAPDTVLSCEVEDNHGEETFTRNRLSVQILGGAYWFPHKDDARDGSALLIDYDRYKFDNFDAKANPEQKKFEVHWLVNW